MKLFYIFFLFFTVVSCQYFDKKVPSETELLQQELQKINWNEVDEFPTVLQCDTIKDITLKRQCFFDFITQTIKDRIEIDSFAIENPEMDTLKIKVTVNPDSRILFESQFLNDSISLSQKNKIDSILTLRLSDFPNVEPAIKRGIKVKSQFILPIALKENIE